MNYDYVECNVTVSGFVNLEEKTEIWDFLLRGEGPSWLRTVSDSIYFNFSDERMIVSWGDILTALSKKWPHLLFEVEAEGVVIDYNNITDSFRARFRGGKHEIIYPEQVWPEYKTL